MARRQAVPTFSIKNQLIGFDSNTDVLFFDSPHSPIFAARPYPLREIYIDTEVSVV